MPVQVACSKCNAALAIPDEHVGRPILCPYCNSTVSVTPPAPRGGAAGATTGNTANATAATGKSAGKSTGGKAASLYPPGMGPPSAATPGTTAPVALPPIAPPAPVTAPAPLVPPAPLSAPAPAPAPMALPAAAPPLPPLNPGVTAGATAGSGTPSGGLNLTPSRQAARWVGTDTATAPPSPPATQPPATQPLPQSPLKSVPLPQPLPPARSAAVAPPAPPPAVAVPQAARFIAADPTAGRVPLGADGKLPMLVLVDGEQEPEKAEKPAQNAPPWLLILALGFSITASVALLFVDTATGRIERQSKAEAREALQRFYVGDEGKQAAFQHKVRLVIQANQRGDREEERQYCRELLNMLHSESNNKNTGLTGRRDDPDPPIGLPNDRHLISLINVLLNN